MGYTFKIGQYTPVPDSYEDEDEDGNTIIVEYVGHDVESATSDDAPTFPNDELTGNGNSRHPSYSAWSDFCKEVNIYDFFYTSRGHLKAEHPGVQYLTEDDAKYLTEKLEVYKLGAILPPGFAGFPVYDPLADDHVSPDEGKYDHQLARLMWLEFWVNWAVKNCENPAIVNW